MSSTRLFKVVAFSAVMVIIIALAWLTTEDNNDPCDQPQVDITAAVIADEHGDQDALANRAIILRGNCEEE